jgi:hypothetical protein
MIRVRRLMRAFVTVAFVLVSRAALAGPPLVCFPFEIGDARTLPMGANGWHSTDPTYEVSRLIDDTLALLTPETPVLVRMETLRRATIYAASDSARATALLNALQERARVPHAKVGLNVFDFGYLVETYRQAKPLFPQGGIPAIDRIDGYQLVLKAYGLQGDPAMQFAAAVITAGYSATRAESLRHLEQAKAHAQADRTLALNISTHFQ